jgi:hypothetical protein
MTSVVEECGLAAVQDLRADARQGGIGWRRGLFGGSSIWNGAVTRQPALFALCETVEDVQAAGLGQRLDNPRVMPTSRQAARHSAHKFWHSTDSMSSTVFYRQRVCGFTSVKRGQSTPWPRDCPTRHRVMAEIIRGVIDECN